MHLQPWHHTAREGFTLRGWHSRPTGKPLLHFIHGNGFCARAYEPMLTALANDFDLWLFDVQGHGDSDHGGRFVGWNRNADLAVEALQKHGKAFEQVQHYALGHSFGGVLTGLILGDHRKLFERAVLLDPVIFTPAILLGMSMGELSGVNRLTPLVRQARGRRRHWANRDEAYASLHGRGVYREWRDDALRAFIEHGLRDAPDGGVELKCRPSREAHIFGSAPDRLWTLLGRVRTPTLVLRASHTYPFIAESVQRWQWLNNAIEAEKVEGRHCFMQARPEETAARVRAFLLASTEGASAP